MSWAEPPYAELDWETGPLATGLVCYREGKFFEAHEHWEAVWLTKAEPTKSFLQAVIQVTAACHHWRRGNVEGAASLLARSLRRLELCPAYFGGLDVVQLRTGIAVALHQLEQSARTESIPAIRIHTLYKQA